jgi:hypothetical protein
VGIEKYRHRRKEMRRNGGKAGSREIKAWHL